MKKVNKELICRYLACFWLVVVIGFLGLQTASDLISVKKKPSGNTQSELVLAVSHHAPAADFTPDLKFIQDWFQHDHLDFGFKVSVYYWPWAIFHSHLKIELIRLLQTSISINAP
jgi:hypothetical protein